MISKLQSFPASHEKSGSIDRESEKGKKNSPLYAGRIATDRFLGEDCQVPGVFGQNLSRTGYKPMSRRAGESISESLSASAEKQSLALCLIAQAFGQFGRAIAAAKIGL